MLARTIGPGLAVVAALAATVPTGRTALGQFGRWGAFRDAAPARCYAIAEPLGGAPAYLTVASWPAAGMRSAVQLRLRRPARSPILARVGAATVALTVRDRDARAPDLRRDRRLAALLREGAMLEIDGRDLAGGRVRERFPLSGAASAIDAMRLACLAA